MDADQRLAHRKRYVKLCVAGRRQARQALSQELEAREAELEALVQSLSDLAHQLQSVAADEDCQAMLDERIGATLQRILLLRRTLEDYDQLATAEAEVHGEEYDMLCRLPGVQRVEVSGRLIRVFTEPIVIRRGGHSHRLGRYRLEIRVGHSVRMFNLDYKPKDHKHVDHPHIHHGKPCLGNMRRFFADCLTAHRYADLIQQGLEFLRSYNPGNSYCKLEAWPRCDPAVEETAENPSAADEHQADSQTRRTGST